MRLPVTAYDSWDEGAAERKAKARPVHVSYCSLIHDWYSPV